MPTHELTPEMVKQFVEDATNLLDYFEYGWCELCDMELEEEEDRCSQVKKTLKILKHVYLKKVD